MVFFYKLRSLRQKSVEPEIEMTNFQLEKHMFIIKGYKGTLVCIIENMFTCLLYSLID